MLHSREGDDAMTVWIVNPFDTLPFELSRPLRYWLMAEAFAKAGHAVTYWTADFNHVTKRPRDMAGADRSRLGGIDVRPVHEPPYRRNVGLKRLWAHWRWAKNWKAAAMKAPQPPEIVVASSPPLSICKEVRAFAKEAGAKVIVDVMDAWPETFERVAPRWLLTPLRRLARANYLGADAITAVADSYAELVRRYGYSGRVRRFYHGISLKPAPGRAPGGGTRIVYAGSLGRTYDIETAIEAVEMLEGASLAIAGKGEQEESLRRRRNVRFAGYLGEDELAAFLASGDVGLVPMAPESCVGVPYKLADYANAGLAVASSLGGESDGLLAKYNAGVAYRAGDPQSLAEAIRRLAPRIDEAKAGARRMAEAEFDAGKIYMEYVGFAEEVARA